MTDAEKKEVIVECYSKTLDKSMAYRKARLSKEEIELCEQDQDLQDRLDYYLIRKREDLMVTLTNLSLNDSPKISLQATIELGKMIYPESFAGNLNRDAANVITDREVEDFFNNAVKS